MALCITIRGEAATVFEALEQYNIGTRGGTEKFNHTLRECLEQHLNNANFLVLQINFKNASNTVSRKAVIKAVTEFSPHHLPWVLVLYHWCRAVAHHGEAQVGGRGPAGRPLGLLLLPRIIRQLNSDPICQLLLFNKWFL